MLKFKGNENKLLKVVKYTPPVFILIISILISVFLYVEYKKNVLFEKKQIEEQYIIDGKQKIKSIVDTAHQTINGIRKDSILDLKKEIQNNVNNAYHIAYSIYNKYKNTKNHDEIKEIIKTALRNIRFLDDRGYFFIYAMDGTNILHSELREFEGKNFWDYQDAKGTYLTRRMNKIMRNKSEAFSQWYWYKPNKGNEQYKKLGFFKKFEPFGWFIGTGEYIDDFNREIKQKILTQIQRIEYSNSNYIFIVKKDGLTLTNKNLNLIGKNIHLDPGGLKELSKHVKDANSLLEGKYVEYKIHSNIHSDESPSKISYLKYLKEWDWIIGTGFDLNQANIIIDKKQHELEEKYDSYLKNSIIITTALIVILLLISQFLSNYIKNIFFTYKKETQHKEALLYQQSKMASMGEMLGNIAHQWRQPLSMISTCATGTKLQSEMGLIGEKEVNESFDTINNTAQHLSQTIEDFRTYFNPKNNKVCEFGIEDCINKALTLVNAQFLNNEIVIIKEITNVKIESLENELIQALVNILNNSRDALLENNIDEKRYIFIKTFKEENSLVIKIYDNAKGIPENIINRVFEPYFTTKHQSHGTGIGLYMTQDIIVKLLHGSIRATNIDFNYKDFKYTGACFTINLETFS